MKKKNKGGRPKGPPTKVIAFRVLKKRAKVLKPRIQSIIDTDESLNGNK